MIFTGDWSMPVKEAEATNSLVDQGVDVFTMHVDGPKVIVETAAKRGKMVCGYHASQAKLAPQRLPDRRRVELAHRLQDRRSRRAQAGKPHPNFLRGGLKEGYVKMSAYGPMVTDAGEEEGRRRQGQDDRGHASTSSRAPLKDNKGAVVIPAGKTLKQTDLELEKMNYLVEGVVGSALSRRSTPADAGHAVERASPTIAPAGRRAGRRRCCCSACFVWLGGVEPGRGLGRCCSRARSATGSRGRTRCSAPRR